MRALLFRSHGGLDQVYIGETEKRAPGAGQVLVKTRAAALNHLDLFVLAGMPGIELAMPHVPGSDGAGIVSEIGEGVTRFAPGQRVMLNACLWCGRCEFCLAGEHSLCIKLRLIGEHTPGTMAEYFVAPESSLEEIPEGIGFEEAAAFSLVFQTAWRMLHTRAALRAGEDVFIHGIGGGVASAALQIAKLAGASVFVSSSSDEKLARARADGADYTFNYRQQDIVREVLRETGKRGVDVVVDNVGAKTWLQSLKLVCKGGRIVTCGATTGANPETEIRLIFWKQIQILGSTMCNAAEYRQLVQLLARRRLRPAIDQVFPLQQGSQALEHLQREQQYGKIVLRID